MSNKTPWETDVNVLLIFFAREDVLAKTFDAIRAVKPRRILLWQDGARDNHPEDAEHIMRCREVVENIDWDCEVYRKYNEKNYGCDPSTFYAHKWGFSIVDKLIVLEDDFVADPSFFAFCKEMLDRYENDERIAKICGMNQVENFKCEDSYFFTASGSPGWASWKRVAETWDEDYSFLDDENTLKLIRNCRTEKYHKDYEKMCFSHKEQGIPHWETIQTYARVLNSQLNIFPAKNLVKNIGLGEYSTHSKNPIECIPKQLRNVYYMDKETLDFPLKHPKYVIENVEYEQRLFRHTGKGYPLIKMKLRLEGILLRIRYKGIMSLIKK